MLILRLDNPYSHNAHLDLGNRFSFFQSCPIFKLYPILGQFYVMNIFSILFSPKIISSNKDRCRKKSYKHSRKLVVLCLQVFFDQSLIFFSRRPSFDNNWTCWWRPWRWIHQAIGNFGFEKWQFLLYRLVSLCPWYWGQFWCFRQ